MVNEKSVVGNAVVLGAGVMGAGIAALLANAGWRVHLLDRVPDDATAARASRNRLAQAGLERVLKARPPQFALPEFAARVVVGNTEDDLACLREADWVVEAVAENLAVKQSLFQAVAAHVGAEAVISSNTSGLDLSAMVRGCPDDFRARFLGTHFFNPPRLMKPLELVPTSETRPEVTAGFAAFAERVLGKRVIPALPTPGFISTRLGMYALCRTLGLAEERGISVETADALTGTLLGRPKSGTFRLADVVGLDITAQIAENLTAALPADASYRSLRLPDSLRHLVAQGAVGAKSGAGYYRREADGTILSFDLSRRVYRPRLEPTAYPGNLESLPLKERLPRLWAASPAHDGGFLREMLRETIGYMARVTPQVASRIVEVDDALIGGFGWELGPFHLLDLLPELKAELAPSLPYAVPERFYTHASGRHSYYDFRAQGLRSLPRPADRIVLKDERRSGGTVMGWQEAALVDIGDGVACLEWWTKMGTLTPVLSEVLAEAYARASRDFTGLVIAGSGEPFCAGFDLGWIAARIEAQEWRTLDSTMRRLQTVLQGVRYGAIPVVAAVNGWVLGGGCEVMLHCSGVQAASESGIGLPEANVGLIPVGGGTASLFVRTMAGVPPAAPLERADPFPLLRGVWERLRLAHISTSAEEARQKGYLRDVDGISRHPDRLLYEAKERVRLLAESYAPPVSRAYLAPGADGFARFQWELHALRRADRVTAHDAKIAAGLAKILCGGDLIHAAEVTEARLLELEREVFLSLAGTGETLARIKSLLATGKPLRN
jgi:3-hydroxyacyl-CoA dehydrogenase